MRDIVIPSADENSSARGSLKALLSENVGRLVRAEYETRTQPEVRQGAVYAVGEDYLLLWDESRKTYSAGKLENLAFVTFFPEKE